MKVKSGREFSLLDLGGKMKRFCVLLAALVVAVLLTACDASVRVDWPASDDWDELQTAVSETDELQEAEMESLAGEGDEMVKLNVACMPNYASLWAVLTGIDRGFFEDEGIEITLWEFEDSMSEIEALEDKSIDIAYIDNEAHKLCVNGQAAVFASDSVYSNNKIVVLRSSGVKSLDSIEKLKGKKIAYSAVPVSETALNGVLKVAGLTRNDVQVSEMAAAEMVAAMASGSVDACAAWSPYNIQIMNMCKGAREIEFDTDFVDISSWVCRPAYASKNRDILVRFSRAIYRAMAYASQKDNWDYAVGLYAMRSGKYKEECYAEAGNDTWFGANDIKNYIEDDSIQDYYLKQQEMFIESGDVEEKLPVENYVLFDVMKEALGN